ncbi:MAG: hypothetical protein ABRQ38_27660, partial [Candidatus Eremiobacterota bacterium]
MVARMVYGFTPTQPHFHPPFIGGGGRHMMQQMQIRQLQQQVQMLQMQMQMMQQMMMMGGMAGGCCGM